MTTEPVTVFQSEDPVLIAMAETLLRDAGIVFTLEEGDPSSRILVDPGETERALVVLDEMPEGSGVDDEAADSAWNQ